MEQPQRAGAQRWHRHCRFNLVTEECVPSDTLIGLASPFEAGYLPVLLPDSN